MAATFIGPTWRGPGHVGRGLTLEQIKDELLNGRNLSKKGSRKRQLDYARRTAWKAIDQFRARG